MIKTVEFTIFYSITQLSYFFMIHLVIFSSTNMLKSTYAIVRLEVLVKKTKFVAYVEFYVSSELYATITTSILEI